MELARLGVFWEGNGDREGVIEGEDQEQATAEAEREQEEREWEKEVVSALESLKTVQVADGCGSVSSSE